MRMPLQTFEPGTARAQKQPKSRALKLWRGGFCVNFRADAESVEETGRRARRRRSSAGPRGAELPPGRP
eukprot:11324203-Alexandrium_andersonii.AAC.1